MEIEITFEGDEETVITRTVANKFEAWCEMERAALDYIQDDEEWSDFLVYSAGIGTGKLQHNAAEVWFTQLNS